jgi:hypothetical protein
MLKSPPAGSHLTKTKYLESYDYDERKSRMRSKLLEEVVERFCEMFQAGCGTHLFH